MTIFSENLGGMAPLAPPGYAYGARGKKQVWRSHVRNWGL